MHAITVNEEGQAEMFSADEVPWHRLGTVVEGKATSQEAIEYAHLDWQVAKEKMSLISTGEKIGEFDAIVRQDNKKVLGVARGRYELIQNTEAFDFFDSVVGEKQAYYETAGSLHEGRVIWIMAKLPGQMFIDSNPEDKIEKNILLVTSHNLTFSLMMQICATRVVCWNTLTAALNEDTPNRIKIRHTKSYKKKVEEAQKALNLAAAYFGDLQGLINLLAKTPMDVKEMQGFSEKLFPSKEEEASTRITNIRESLTDLFANGKGNLGRSRWDALNAVTEFIDHHRSFREGSTRFESGLLGSGAILKQKAVNLLTP